jgi:hypothetical protein
VAEGGGDVGLAVLAEDADGKVAQGSHGAGQGAGADLGVVLAERAIPDVMWCRGFSMPQWPLIQVESSVQVASKTLRLVIR